MLKPLLPAALDADAAAARGCARRRGGHGGSYAGRSSGRSFAKRGNDAFVAPCEWQWSQRRNQQGGIHLFVRLPENCLGRLLRAEVSLYVQGSLFL